MDAVSSPEYETVVLMKSAQTGGTEILNNVVGYHIAQDPAPILMVMPTLTMAESWSKDRLAPMLRDTPCLKGKVREPRARNSQNTLLHKVFPGGHITIAGANSPASLASRPIRIVGCDEVDRFPPSAGAEGDPVNLARKRSTTFWNRKALLVSTPTVKGRSRIEAAYEGSDQQHFEVPCALCGEFQRLRWAQVKWAKENGKHDPDTAYYECEHCEGALTDADKLDMLAAGRWVADNPGGNVAGFHISELYSPWVTFSQLVATFLEAKRLPETLKTWVNTALGETWEDEGESVDESPLMARREPYGAEELPEGVLVLTAGVDIQDDRIELEVVGWGREQESWGVDVRVLYGDPGRAQLWEQLDQALQAAYPHASGVRLRILATGVDTGGHYTQHAYRFCKPRWGRRVLALKGAAGADRPLVSRPSTANMEKVRLFTVAVDVAKDLIYSRLRISEPGPGYCHFPAAYDEEYFEQLTAERVVTKYSRGFPVRVWEKVKKRNEALDRRVYAMAAFEIANVNMEAVERRLHGKAERQESAEKPRTITREARKPAKSRPQGWVRSWR